MPRIPPKFGVSALIAVFITAICPTPAPAQTRKEATGYDALIAELGGAPATDYGEVHIFPADTAWSYRKGTSEASSPINAWRAIGFVENGTWTTDVAPFGYGTTGVETFNTELDDMQGNGHFAYSSLFLRNSFIIDPGEIPAHLALRVYVDDGAIVWINGIEVARINVGTDPVSFNSTASSSREAAWEHVVIDNPMSFLVEGTNVVAIHALNSSKNNNDFSIDAELSSALRLTHVEGRSNDNYLPEPSLASNPPQGYAFTGSDLGIFAGKTFHVQSLGVGSSDPPSFGKSNHASTVGSRWYGPSSFSPDITLVDNFDASGWIGGDFLNAGSSSPPDIDSNVIQNHSWIATTAHATPTELDDFVRRQDYAIHRDGYLAMVGLNNWKDYPDLPVPIVPPVFGTAYNAISVGRTDGEHSRGGTPAGQDSPGRIKPEIVAKDTATSYSTPQVGSAATLLLAHANTRGWSAPFTSYVMKAILMAGATKSEFQTGSYTWSRSEGAPLDAVFGAGELNVQHSYHILDAGEQAPGDAGGTHGWDKHALPDPNPGSSSAVYTLVLPEDIAELSCIITWNRIIDGASWLDGGAFRETIANMSLQLHRVSGGGSTLYDSSDSPIDNVEHVYLRNLPAGTYTITVATDVAVDFGIAWRTESGTLPDFTMAPGASADELDFAFTDLAIGKEYILNSSTDLLNWIPAPPFTATATTDSHTLLTGLAAPRTFYKLTWDPVN